MGIPKPPKSNQLEFHTHGDIYQLESCLKPLVLGNSDWFRRRAHHCMEFFSGKTRVWKKKKRKSKKMKFRGSVKWMGISNDEFKVRKIIMRKRPALNKKYKNRRKAATNVRRLCYQLSFIWIFKYWKLKIKKVRNGWGNCELPHVENFHLLRYTRHRRLDTMRWRLSCGD